jgi:Xaa-Pro aminopeptidase
MPETAVPYAFVDFAPAEFTGRIERARRLMSNANLGALLITTEANFRYFTGFRSQHWVMPTRPMFFVLPAAGEPVAIVPTGSLFNMRESSWVKEMRTWMAPQPGDDGVSLLIEALREATGPTGRIGAEFGPELQLRMPINDFLRVREAIRPLDMVDGSDVMRRLRMVKSPAEVARIRAAAQLVSVAFEALPEALALGISERDACLSLQLDILRRGADKIPYMIAASGPGGYQTINSDPSNRVLRRGDLLIIDTGSSIDGYYCDFDRNFAFGPPEDAARRAHDQVYAATDAGITAVRPGARVSEVWQAMAASLGREAVMAASVGRMGHSVGLNLTEPPSIHPDDPTVIEVGMVLTVEPGVGYDTAAGEPRVMVHEENLVVTEHGAELLSHRAPAAMPIIE